jgi:hypothetical protein
MTLPDLLAECAGAVTTHQRATPELETVTLAFPDGRRMILLERTYRDGATVIVDPTEDELAAAKTADLWDLWNSGRGVHLAGVGASGARLFGQE